MLLKVPLGLKVYADAIVVAHMYVSFPVGGVGTSLVSHVTMFRRSTLPLYELPVSYTHLTLPTILRV